jgi:hypothetical protein
MTWQSKLNQRNKTLSSAGGRERASESLAGRASMQSRRGREQRKIKRMNIKRPGQELGPVHATLQASVPSCRALKTLCQTFPRQKYRNNQLWNMLNESTTIHEEHILKITGSPISGD